MKYGRVILGERDQRLLQLRYRQKWSWTKVANELEVTVDRCKELERAMLLRLLLAQMPLSGKEAATFGEPTPKAVAGCWCGRKLYSAHDLNYVPSPELLALRPPMGKQGG